MNGESDSQRHNRELIELLNELRVLLPGVQIIFAFMLAVPFTERFKEIGDFDKAVYFATLCCAAMAAMLLIAPSALHRIDFRLIDKGALVKISNRLAIAGSVFIALAMVGSLAFISLLLWGEAATAVVTAIATALFVGGWYVMPLRWRAKHPEAPRHDE
ncbi:MAG: DUF6328 family protein [Solirubrobacterales bacterium]